MSPSPAAFADPRPKTDAPIRVLLADDHQVTLWGLQQMVHSASPAMAVAGTARNRGELLDHPALSETDVILLDIGLGDADGLELLPELTARCGARVVVLTGNLNPARHRDAVLRGARGVLVKTQPIEALLDAVRRVHAGEVWLDGALMSMLLGELRGGPAEAAAPRACAPSPDERRIASLTAKEREVIRAIVQHRGAKSFVVAEALSMSEHTLRNHLTVIYGKLGVQGKLNLYLYAMEHGLASNDTTPAPAGADHRSARWTQ